MWVSLRATRINYLGGSHVLRPKGGQSQCFRLVADDTTFSSLNEKKKVVFELTKDNFWPRSAHVCFIASKGLFCSICTPKLTGLIGMQKAGS